MAYIQHCFCNFHKLFLKDAFVVYWTKDFFFNNLYFSFLHSWKKNINFLWHFSLDNINIKGTTYFILISFSLRPVFANINSMKIIILVQWDMNKIFAYEYFLHQKSWFVVFFLECVWNNWKKNTLINFSSNNFSS